MMLFDRHRFFFLLFHSSFSSHAQSRNMNTGTSSKRQHFDNLSYISDGRDRISYTNDPYAMPSRDTRAIALQPTELNRSRNEKNITYSYRPGQEGIYAYNNAAFR